KKANRQMGKINLNGHVIHITDGRAQLLAALIDSSSGRLYLDIIPHHYQPQFSLLPQPPLKEKLDGKIYKSLTLRVLVNPGAIIVLGLYNPLLQKEGKKNKDNSKKEKD